MNPKQIQAKINNSRASGGRVRSCGPLCGTYTILVASSSFMVNPSLYATPPYDPYKDFAPVTRAAATPNIIVVHPSVPAKTIKELTRRSSPPSCSS
jgi:tripartite-type tricarboxylate transporter receptor subunit TctC